MNFNLIVYKCANIVKRLKEETRGAVTIEYILLVALIGLTLVVFFQSFGATISGVFTDVNSSMDVSD